MFVYVSQDKKKDCNWITGSSLGGAAVNRDAIYEKTGIDVDFLNLRGVEKIKDAEKIMAKYSIKPEDMQKILSSKWAEAMEILTKYNVNPAHIAQLVLTDVGNHS